MHPGYGVCQQVFLSLSTEEDVQAIPAAARSSNLVPIINYYIHPYNWQTVPTSCAPRGLLPCSFPSGAAPP